MCVGIFAKTPVSHTVVKRAKCDWPHTTTGQEGTAGQVPIVIQVETQPDLAQENSDAASVVRSRLPFHLMQWR